MEAEAQPRAPGGTFAPKRTRPLNATETLHAAELRDYRGEFVVPPPVSMSEFNSIRNYRENDPAYGANALLLQQFRDWMTATAAAGLPSDLARAFQAWKPISAEPKRAMHDHLDALGRQLLTKKQRLDGEAYKERLLASNKQGLASAIEKSQAALDENEREREQLQLVHDANLDAMRLAKELEAA